MRHLWPVALALLLPAPAIAESVTEHLDRGKLEFNHKNFGNAIQILKPLLYPQVQLTSEEDIVLAHEVLGLSFFYVGQEDSAREEFTMLLYLRPSHRLDPFLIPPPAVTFFDQIRGDPALKEKLDQIERERKERERKESEKNQKQPKVEVRRIFMERSERIHSRLWTFLPFGLGQFQNEQLAKGILLASLGGTSLITNVVSYSLLLAIAGDNGKYAPGDLSLAKGLRLTQYVSLGVFAATWVYGVLDANLYFRPVTYGPYRKDRQETEILDDKPVGVMPLLFPDGAGLAIGSRF